MVVWFNLPARVSPVDGFVSLRGWLDMRGGSLRKMEMLTIVRNVVNDPCIFVQWAAEKTRASPRPLVRPGPRGHAFHHSSRPAVLTESPPVPLPQDVFFGFLEAVLSARDLQPAPGLPEQRGGAQVEPDSIQWVLDTGLHCRRLPALRR